MQSHVNIEQTIKECVWKDDGKKQKHAARKSGIHLEISFYFLLLDAFQRNALAVSQEFLFFKRKKIAEKQTVEVFVEMSCEVKRETRLTNSFATKKTLSSAQTLFQWLKNH